MQTSPPAAGGVAPGFMRLTFRVAGKLDFSKYQYLLIFNTSGNGLTPEAGSNHANWSAYSDAIEVQSSHGTPYAGAVQYLKNSDPRVPPTLKRLQTQPSQFQFASDAGGTGSEFSVLFDRSIFSLGASPLSKTWLFNAFTVQPSRVVDSMGRCAGCFHSPALRIDTAFDRIVDSENSHQVAPDARIVSVEFANDP